MNGDAIGFDRDLEASPTIKVEIYDQAYTVRSDGDPEYLKHLAEYVAHRGFAQGCDSGGALYRR